MLYPEGCIRKDCGIRQDATPFPLAREFSMADAPLVREGAIATNNPDWWLV